MNEKVVHFLNTVKIVEDMSNPWFVLKIPPYLKFYRLLLITLQGVQLENINNNLMGKALLSQVHF